MPSGAGQPRDGPESERLPPPQRRPRLPGRTEEQWARKARRTAPPGSSPHPPRSLATPGRSSQGRMPGPCPSLGIVSAMSARACPDQPSAGALTLARRCCWGAWPRPP
eukprot:2606236-Alexandrium_andersonii.AAC.1